jgi:hypothetical protein
MGDGLTTLGEARTLQRKNARPNPPLAPPFKGGGFLHNPGEPAHQDGDSGRCGEEASRAKPSLINARKHAERDNVRGGGERQEQQKIARSGHRLILPAEQL